jgi:hypothetical protein
LLIRETRSEWEGSQAQEVKEAEDAAQEAVAEEDLQEATVEGATAEADQQKRPSTSSILTLQVTIGQ